jgi:hypothetical protein
VSADLVSLGAASIVVAMAFAAAAKIYWFGDFVESLRRRLPRDLTPLIATAVIVAEVATVGVALSGRLGAAAAAAVVLLLAFTVYLVTDSDPGACQCFGAAARFGPRAAMVRNAVLVALGLWGTQAGSGRIDALTWLSAVCVSLTVLTLTTARWSDQIGDDAPV